LVIQLDGLLQTFTNQLRILVGTESSHDSLLSLNGWLIC